MGFIGAPSLYCSPRQQLAAVPKKCKMASQKQAVHYDPIWASDLPIRPYPELRKKKRRKIIPDREKKSRKDSDTVICTVVDCIQKPRPMRCSQLGNQIEFSSEGVTEKWKRWLFQTLCARRVLYKNKKELKAAARMKQKVRAAALICTTKSS